MKKDAGESIVSPLAKRKPNKADVYATTRIKNRPSSFKLAVKGI